MTRWIGLAAWSGLALATGLAQTHVVKKPETVVRAVGVYEWTGELGKAKASRFVPVTVFIDGQLQDAGVYLARPVPFALETGTLFELDRAGVADGTLELAYARHLVTTGAAEIDDGWLGYGAYKAPPPVKLAAAKKSGPLSKVEVSGGKPEASGPKFSKKPEADAGGSGHPTLTRKTGSDSGTGASPEDTKSTAAPADDADRPTMRRPAGDSSAKDSADAKDSGGSGGANDPERPTLRKRTEAQRKEDRKQHDASSVTGIGSLNDDPDRPNLHRGSPVSRMDEEALPPLRGTPPDMKQLVAVSDAKTRDEHNFARAWAEEAERTAVLGKMQALARARLAAYDGGVGKAGVAPAASGATHAAASGAAHTAAAGVKRVPGKKPEAPVPAPLNDEVLRGFTLSYGGAATYFYMASAGDAGAGLRYVSIVAQQEPAGDLKVALASVTDAKHLDRTPWMRLVDAVDVEASNRASLLMELRAQNSRSFAVYRVIGAEAEQRFVTGSTE